MAGLKLLSERGERIAATGDEHEVVPVGGRKLRKLAAYTRGRARDQSPRAHAGQVLGNASSHTCAARAMRVSALAAVNAFSASAFLPSL